MVENKYTVNSCQANKHKNKKKIYQLLQIKE